jgi:hypothetical protein
MGQVNRPEMGDGSDRWSPPVGGRKREGEGGRVGVGSRGVNGPEGEGPAGLKRKKGRERDFGSFSLFFSNSFSNF